MWFTEPPIGQIYSFFLQNDAVGEARFGIRLSRAHLPVLHVLGMSSLGKLFKLLNLSFLICKMKTVILMWKGCWGFGVIVWQRRFPGPAPGALGTDQAPNLRTRPRPTESEALGVGPSSLCKPVLREILMPTHTWECLVWRAWHTASARKQQKKLFSSFLFKQQQQFFALKDWYMKWASDPSLLVGFS